MGIGDAGLGFLAGLLSTVSPCVLPLLPLVLGAAAATHRFGAVMLALGLIVSFVTMGVAIAAIGVSAGLNEDVFRSVSAVFLAAFGIVLLSGASGQRIVAGFAGVIGNGLISRLSPTSLFGQFTLGLALGVAWSPCVGPTLGAASLLAAKGQDLGHVSLTMAAFALGAAVPLLLAGSISRALWAHWHGRIRQAGRTGRWLLGGVLVTMAVLILSGLDRRVETALVNASPDWLIDVTTWF